MPISGSAVVGSLGKGLEGAVGLTRVTSEYGAPLNSTLNAVNLVTFGSSEEADTDQLWVLFLRKQCWCPA